MEASRAHWQEAYGAREPDQVSWFEESPRFSLELVAEAAVPRTAAIIDVGGGASRLASVLIETGYSDLTVADISARALARARGALGDRAGEVEWLEVDVRDHTFERRYDIWHDRAVFHFMHEAEEREGYLRTLRGGLRTGGNLLLATFGPEGPERCSGLPVRRYDAEELAELIGPGFELASERLRTHHTPNGATQQFLYTRFRRRDGR